MAESEEVALRDVIGSVLTEETKFLRFVYFNNSARAKCVYLPLESDLQQLSELGIALSAKPVVSV